MPLQNFITKDEYHERYFKLIGKPVRVHTNGGFALGVLEKISVNDGIILRPSLVDETTRDKCVYRLERLLPNILETTSLKGINPVSQKYLDDLLKLYCPQEDKQLELF